MEFDAKLLAEFMEFLQQKEKGSTKKEVEEKPKKKKTKKSKYTKRNDGRYATTVFVGNDVLGKPIRKYICANTIAELDAKVLEIRLEKEKGTDFTKRNMTFGQYRKRWWNTKLLTIKSVGNRKMYEGTFKYLEVLDYDLLVEVSTDDIQRIINKNKDKARTCQKIRMVLNEIFKKAISERILYYNPVDAVVIPQYKAKERRPLTEDEDYLTELNIFTDREQAYLYIIKYCGLRKEEALALEKGDFSLPEARLRVSKAIAFDGNKSFLKETKNGVVRAIPLPNNILPFISYYLSNLDEELLFTNLSSNTYMTHTGYRRMWEAIIRKLEKAAKESDRKIGNDLTAHIFRHNYACMLMKANIDMKERQYLLGHKTISVTMDIYTHIEEQKMSAPSLLNIYINESK